MQSSAAALIALLLGSLADLHAADVPAHKPTFADVPYGPHEKQKLDFYEAKSDKPTPVVFFIHGGGWLNGDKGGFNNEKPYLNAGISVVSINYRLIPDADKLVPPVQGPLLDAARALQFARSKAAKWNLDKQRIGATGSSAGSCSALWLAFHPDLADAKSADPVARESTRLWCVAMGQAQESTAHSANFGVGLQQRCQSLRVECELVYPGAPDVKHADAGAYLIEQLKAK